MTQVVTLNSIRHFSVVYYFNILNLFFCSLGFLFIFIFLANFKKKYEFLNRTVKIIFEK